MATTKASDSLAARRLRIAMVCDFFYPRVGGVEMHIWSLSQFLIRRGHKVVVITHSYGNRKGVRYMAGPLKVYYCPFTVMTDEDTIPTFTASLPLMRWIFIRERIDVVHAHQATSTMANESVVYASALGIASVYTDHSLFGFDDVASVILNRVLQTTLSTVDAAICVSNTCRENLILRTHLDPSIVHRVPNAIDPSKFTPDPSLRRDQHDENGKEIRRGRIKVVVMSRLVYRKGVDLLMGVIPIVCGDLPHVDFIIGGDGSKRRALQNAVKLEGFQDRVEFLGAVPHADVRDVLCRGHIFLNCSLTESFGIAILEAACCGLLVVATNVGGVPEVLPDDMVHLSVPKVDVLATHLKRAVARQQGPDAVDPWETHRRIKTMYSWSRVGEETTNVYKKVLSQDRRDFLERLECYHGLGGMSGLVAGILLITFEFWLIFVKWWQPIEHIDVVPDLFIERNEDRIGKAPIEERAKKEN